MVYHVPAATAIAPVIGAVVVVVAESYNCTVAVVSVETNTPNTLHGIGLTLAVAVMFL
jgi:hypothetical protein